MVNVMFGSDPEFFLLDNNGKHIPPAFLRLHKKMPFSYLDNDFEHRHPVFFNNGSITVHEDGSAIELTVPPSEEAEKVFDDIQLGLIYAQEEFSKFGIKDIVAYPAIKYDFENWNKYGEEMIYCNRAGCDPDLDINRRLDEQNEELDMSTHPYRYGGGHIHTSTLDERIKNLIKEDESRTELIKLFGISLGIANIALSEYPKLEKIRQFRFGKPGKYRVQNYKDGSIGVEYRTPSNSWTTNWNAAKTLFYLANKCFDIITDKERTMYINTNYAYACKLILSGNQKNCMEFYEDFVAGEFV